MTYKYQDFPKYINTPDGKRHIAKTAVDEMNILAPFKEKSPVVLSDVTPVTVVTVGEPITEIPQENIPTIADSLSMEDDLLECDKPDEASKEALIARAEALGVIYDKRWGIVRLTDMIAAAEAANRLQTQPEEAHPEESVA